MTLFEIITVASIVVSVATTLFVTVAKKGNPEAPLTANQKLIEAGLRAASGFLVVAHGRGVGVTNPMLITDAISAVGKFLGENYRESAIAAGATAKDLEHIAASATANAVATLAPVLDR